MKRRATKSEREPTIALINIVFLMLIFFLVAGTIAPAVDRDLSLVRTAELDGRPPADALVIHADGRMAWNGADIPDAADILPMLPEGSPARLLPDRDLSAGTLVHIGHRLRAAGAGQVVIITQGGLE